MKRSLIFLFLFLVMGWIFLEVEDIFYPSDSGDMKLLNYKITKFKANRGEVKSKMHLLSYYQYNDENLRGSEISSLIKDIIGRGYGGLGSGGDGVTVDLINECERGRILAPPDVANAFEIIKKTGGGLTQLGREIELRWQKGDFVKCPFYESK